MTSSTNELNRAGDGKPFHTYENVGYDAGGQQDATPGGPSKASPPGVAAASTSLLTATLNGHGTEILTADNPLDIAMNGGTIKIPLEQVSLAADNPNGDENGDNNIPPQLLVHAVRASTDRPSPGYLELATPNITPNPASLQAVPTAKILSAATDSAGVTRMLAPAGSAIHCVAPLPQPTPIQPHHHQHQQQHHQQQQQQQQFMQLPLAQKSSGQNLVTKLIAFPTQSPMDSLKEWSVNTFKCTRQLINEKRGLCPMTNDLKLQNDIELLHDNRSKLVQMLRAAQQMAGHYSQLVRTQRQLHTLMNEMSVKCFTSTSLGEPNQAQANGQYQSNYSTAGRLASKQLVVASHSSLVNNRTAYSPPTSGSSMASCPRPTRQVAGEPHDFHHLLPVLDHMKTAASVNLADDFKKNAMSLNVAIKNGEKLLAALYFYCSNLSTLIDKTIEDTLSTIRQFEAARLEYDAERNCANNFLSPSAKASTLACPGERLELARMRYAQLREDVQIKMRLLEENTAKVMHKQLLIFNGAFASYTSGDTVALNATLRQFNIKDTSPSLAREVAQRF